MSFNEKFDSLLDILESGKKVPFSNMVMVNADVAQRIALELKESFPEEFRSAQRLLNEKNTFIETARKEADSILDSARKEKENLISKESIVKEAEERVIQMKDSAKRESVEMLKNMSNVVIEIANRFRENLVDVDHKMGEAYKSVSDSIQKIKIDYIDKV
jgi:predicted Zn-dependent protease with MMP-like domain